MMPSHTYEIERIVSAAEWMQHPTWHGSYDDYVRHMRGLRDYFARLAEDRLAQKIATKLADKLRRSGK